MEKKFEIAFAQQETIADAAEQYGIDPQEFIRAAIENHYKKVTRENRRHTEFDWDKGMRAIERMLDQKGYGVLDHDYEGFDLVAADKDGAIAFIKVDMGDGDMPEEKVKGLRGKFEHAAFHYFGENEVIDGTPCRCDYISLAVHNGNRAMLRHHIDCINDGKAA